jgi:hypothetical protein
MMEAAMQWYPANAIPLSRSRRLSLRPGEVVLAIAALAVFLTTSMHAWATPGEILIVTGADVALRATPGPESKIIERLDKNDRIMEFERRDGWVRGMLFGAIGREGWVAARHLKAEADGREDQAPRAPSRAPDGISSDEPEARAQSVDEGEAYTIRRRERVYLYCLDCGLPRRHENRRPHDRPNSEVWKVPRDRTHDRKPPPVIRVVPRSAPVWGGESRR